LFTTITILLWKIMFATINKTLLYKKLKPKRNCKFYQKLFTVMQKCTKTKLFALLVVDFTISS